MSERNIDERVAILEQIARDSTAAMRSLDERLRSLDEHLRRVDETVVRIDERLNTALPHLATKAELTAGLGRLELELEKKPGKIWLATAVGVLLVAYAAGLAGLAALPVIARLLAAL